MLRQLRCGVSIVSQVKQYLGNEALTKWKLSCNAAAHAEAAQASSGQQAEAIQGQVVSEVKGFLKVAKDGIRKRQAALHYARSSWQVRPSQHHQA